VRQIGSESVFRSEIAAKGSRDSQERQHERAGLRSCCRGEVNAHVVDAHVEEIPAVGDDESVRTFPTRFPYLISPFYDEVLNVRGMVLDALWPIPDPRDN
jgi:hypothetical protein